LFGLRNGKYYCRACIKYNGKKANIKKDIKPKIIKADLPYSLSKEQENASLTVANSLKDIYIDAVCGSGKTEIIFRSIEKAIREGKRVGFAIPRREVTEEIYYRLKEVYPKINIALVYGGHNEFLDGDIIVLTCHQCYRYKNKFGLLIIDEYDAFPLKGDDTLLSLCKKSCYGKIIYLSATFTKEFLENKNKTSINRRYHKFDIPIPEYYIGDHLSIVFNLIKTIKHLKGRTIFIYVPTIFQGLVMQFLLKMLLFQTILFTSKSENKKELLDSIRNKKNKLIICTTILERGITVKDLDIIVFNCDHKLFDAPTLIQIVGRVGRKINSTSGKALFMAKKISQSMNECMFNLVDKNNGIV